MPTGRDTPGADSPGWRMLADFLGIRSRFLDDVVRDAVASGISQVVVLAAGLDVRAQRLDALEGCTLYEVDQPAVLAFKDDVLTGAGAASRGRRHLVCTDLRDDWTTALVASGFDADLASVWLAEGLLPYLPAQAESDLFDRVTELSAPGSRAGVEFVHDIGDLMDSALMTSSGAEFGVDFQVLWSREERESADAGLRRRVWITESESVEEAAARFGRELDPDVARSVGRHARLLSARRA